MKKILLTLLVVAAYSAANSQEYLKYTADVIKRNTSSIVLSTPGKEVTFIASLPKGFYKVFVENAIGEITDGRGVAFNFGAGRDQSLDALNAEEIKTMMQDPTYIASIVPLPKYYKSISNINTEWSVGGNCSIIIEGKEDSKTTMTPHGASILTIVKGYIVTITFSVSSMPDENVSAKEKYALLKGFLTEVCRSMNIIVVT